MNVAERTKTPATTGGMEITEYTKRDLRALVEDESFWMQPRLPITRRRAFAQIANPRADEKDTVLLTAHSNGQLIAYLGVLPDRVATPQGGPVRFGWLTAWWADKESKQRLAGMKVLFTAMKRYGNKVAASFPSSEAARAYIGTGLFQEQARNARSYFILSLPPSAGVLGRVTRWLAGAKNRLVCGRAVASRQLQIEAVETLNEGMKSFIDDWAREDPLSRDSVYWNWVLQHPWMSAGVEDRAVQKSYEFSVFAEDFRQIALFVGRHGKIAGFLVLTLRDGRLTLKYACYDPADVADVAIALRSTIANINPWLFVCGDSGIEAQLRKGIPFYITRRMKSSAIYASKSLPESAWSRPQPGTGDSVFT